MSLKARALLLVAACLAAPLVSRADTVYMSRDGQGQVVYSDRPPALGKIDKTLDIAPLPSTPLPESVLRYRLELSKSMQRRLDEEAAPRTAPLPTLFTAAWCGYCRQAKAYLAGRKLRYEEIDVDTPEGSKALARVGGAGLPFLVWNERKLQGYTVAGYDAFFATPAAR